MATQVLQVLIQGKNDSDAAFKAFQANVLKNKDLMAAFTKASEEQRARMVADFSKMADAQVKAAQKGADAEIKAIRQVELAHSAALKQQADMTKRAADAQVAALQATGRAAKDVGGWLTASVTAPLVGAAGASLKFAADFKGAMQQSIAIMGPLDASMRQTMERTARDVAKTTVHSAEDAAKAYYYLASAGMDASQSVAALPKVAAFAQAGMFDMAKATDYLVNSVKALGMGSKDATENTRALALVSDVLVVAANKSNANIQQFAEALSTKAAADMRAFNVSIYEGVAALAVLADQGVKGATAGEKLDIFFRDITKAVRTHSAAWREAGVQFYDSQGNIRNLADIIGDLEKHFKGMSAEAKIAELAHLGFQSRSQGVTLQLLGTSSAMREYQGELKKSAGATQEIADKQLQTFDQQLKLVQKSLKDVGIELGIALMPHAQQFINDFAKPTIAELEKLIAWFRDLPDAAQKAGIALATGAVLAGPALFFFGQLATSITNLIALYRALAAAQGLAATGGALAGVGTGVAIGAGVIGTGAAVGGGIGALFRNSPAALSRNNPGGLEGVSLGQAWDEIIARWTGVTDRLEAVTKEAREANAAAIGPRMPNYDPFTESGWAGLKKWAGYSPPSSKTVGSNRALVPTTFKSSVSGLEYQSSIYGLDRSTQDRIRKLLYDSGVHLRKAQADQMKETYKDNEALIKQRMALELDLEKSFARDKVEVHNSLLKQINFLQDQNTKDIKGRLKKESAEYKQGLRDNIEAMQESLASISNIGNAVGGVGGQIFGQLANSMQGSIKRLRDGTANHFEEMLAGVLENPKVQTTLNGIAAAVQAAMGGYAVGKQLASPGKGAAAGAASGAMAGMAFGPYGMAAGAIIGGVAGFFGGKKGQKEQREAMEEMRKQLILAYGSIEKLRQQASLLGVDISRAFSTQSPKEFQKIVEQLNQAIADHQRKLAAVNLAVTSIGGITGVVGAKGMYARGTGLSQDEIDRKAAKYEASLQGQGLSDDEIKQKVNQRRNQLTGTPSTGGGGINLLAGTGATNSDTLFGFSRVSAESNAKDQGTIFSAIFWASVKENGLLASVDAMQGPFDALKDKITTTLGPETADAVLGPMGHLFDAIQNNEGARGALEGVDALKGALSGLADSGYLTTDAFGAIERQGVAAFQQMTDAGVPVNTALQAMAPLIQEAINESEKFGIPLDANMQHMKEMAEASGIAFQTDPMEKMVDLLTAIANVLGADIPASVSAAGSALTTELPAGAEAAAGAAGAAMDTLAQDVSTGADSTVQAIADMFTQMSKDADTGSSEVSGFIDKLNDLEVNIPVTFHTTNGVTLPPGTFGYNDDGTPDNDGDKTNSLAVGFGRGGRMGWRGGPGLIKGDQLWQVHDQEMGWVIPKGEWQKMGIRSYAGGFGRGSDSDPRERAGVGNAGSGDLIGSGTTSSTSGLGTTATTADVSAVEQRINDKLDQIVSALSSVAEKAPTVFNVSSNPKLVLEEHSIVRTSDSVEAMGRLFLPAVDRAFRLNTNGLMTRVIDGVKAAL